MKKLLKTIIFFGTDDFSLVTLKELVESGYIIAAVVTKPDNKSGRGQRIEMSNVKKFAIEHGIDVWQPDKVLDINEKIFKLGRDVAGVLVSFGKIIPKSTINLFKPGIINVHPSLLPLYRGPSPIESVIENGDKQTGVSIMQLTPKMDAGPVYGRITYKLSGSENRIDLRKKLSNIGTVTLLLLLPKILCGSIKPVPQDEIKATYCKLLTKDNAWLKPDKITAVTAECLIRAHLDFPKTKIDILGKTIVITKAHVSTQQKTPLDIICQDKNYLSIDELLAPSGRKMSASDFINGYL